MTRWVALLVFCVATVPVAASAQESCDDTLAWTRTLTMRLGHSRAQTEIDAARLDAQRQRLEVEVRQLRDEIARLKAKEPEKKKE